MASFPRRYGEIDTIRLNNINIRNDNNSIPCTGTILTVSAGRAYMYPITFALDTVPGLSDLSGNLSSVSTVTGRTTSTMVFISTQLNGISTFTLNQSTLLGGNIASTQAVSTYVVNLSTSVGQRFDASGGGGGVSQDAFDGLSTFVLNQSTLLGQNIISTATVSTYANTLSTSVGQRFDAGGGGGGDPSAWSQYPATQGVNFGGFHASNTNLLSASNAVVGVLNLVNSNSFAAGASNVASNTNSFAAGNNTTAAGRYSASFGLNTDAVGEATVAMGNATSAGADYSYAEGEQTLTSNTADARASHAEGWLTKTGGRAAHAEGYSNIAAGYYSHAEGWSNYASNTACHVEGTSNAAYGLYSHAEGLSNVVWGANAHVEGGQSIANGGSSHAEGRLTVVSTTGTNSHAEGLSTFVKEANSHVEGFGCMVLGGGTFSNAHAEGWLTVASNVGTHAEGISTLASGQYSHAQGSSNMASGNYSHVQGASNVASGQLSHAEGFTTRSLGSNSHAEGWLTVASNTASHAQGLSTLASGLYSHVEGTSNWASGFASHAQGASNTASGSNGFATGMSTASLGVCASAFGFQTIAQTNFSHAVGSYAKPRATANTFSVAGASALGTIVPPTTTAGSAQTSITTLTTATGLLVNSNVFTYLSTITGTTASNITVGRELANGVAGTVLQIMQHVKLDVVGYEQSNAAASAGNGAYFGAYEFLIYRDETSARTMTVVDITTGTTTGFSGSATTVPLTSSRSVNKLYNTPAITVNTIMLAGSASNTYALTVAGGVVGTNYINWLASLDINEIQQYSIY